MRQEPVPEIHILIETCHWLCSKGWQLDTVSFPKGKGLDYSEQQKMFFRRMITSKIELPKNYESNGPDIIARKDDIIWKVECKGLGIGVKSTLRNNFDRALSSTVSYYDKTQGVRLGLAMPQESIYLNLVQNKIPQALRLKLDLWIFLWDSHNQRLNVVEPIKNSKMQAA